MEEYDAEDSVCPLCKKKITDILTNKKMLPAGCILYGKYIVGKMLEYDGYEYIYVGRDIESDQKIIIHELYPAELITRDTTKSLNVTGVSPAEKMCFDHNKKSYMESAEVLCNIEESTLQHVKCAFEENGTAYMICEYIEGIALDHFLELKKTRISEEEILSIANYIVQCLKTLHANDFFAIDLAPQNIFLAGGQIRLLIRGGEIKYNIGKEIQSNEIKPNDGYAAPELYCKDTDIIGKKTDVFAVSALLYSLLSENDLPCFSENENISSLSRIEKKIKRRNVPSVLLKAIDDGLGIGDLERSENFLDFAVLDRYQSLPSEKGIKSVSDSVEKNKNSLFMGSFSGIHFSWKKIVAIIVCIILITSGMTLLKGNRNDSHKNAGKKTVKVASSAAIEEKAEPTDTVAPTEEPTQTPGAEETATPEQTIKPTAAAVPTIETTQTPETTATVKPQKRKKIVPRHTVIPTEHSKIKKRTYDQKEPKKKQEKHKTSEKVDSYNDEEISNLK